MLLQDLQVKKEQSYALLTHLFIGVLHFVLESKAPKTGCFELFLSAWGCIEHSLIALCRLKYFIGLIEIGPDYFYNSVRLTVLSNAITCKANFVKSLTLLYF